MIDILSYIIGGILVIAGIFLWLGLFMTIILGVLEKLLTWIRHFCDWALLKLKTQNTF